MFRLLDTPVFLDHPFRELNRLQETLRHFGRHESSSFRNADLPLNLYLSDNEARLAVVLPGWNAEWIDLTVDGNRLFLKGEVPEGESLPVEGLSTTFQRSVNLPFQIDAEQVSANYTNGVLSITALRLESDKPKQIQVELG